MGDYLVYTTADGDTWDIVALMLYHDEFRADLLMDSNPELTGYAVFPTGLKIKAPMIPAAEAAADTLPPWKRG